MGDRSVLIEIGMLRRCKCGFETMDRTEFRKHLRQNPKHEQNMKGRREPAGQKTPGT
jgi:hypothetical protein